MDEDIFCSPSYRCTVCVKHLPASEFTVNHLGLPYRICKACKAQRVPLGESDPNVRRRLRSGSTTTENIVTRGPKRPRGTHTVHTLPIEPLPARPRGRPRLSGPAQPLPKRPRGRPRLSRPVQTISTSPQRASRSFTIFEDVEQERNSPEIQLDSLTRALPSQELIIEPQYKAFISVFNPYTIPHTLGPMTHECEYCGALHFIQEAVNPSQQCLEFEDCCKRGDVHLDPQKGVTPYLRRLFETDSPDGHHFRKNIRSYNSALAFTSVSYTKDTRIDFSTGVQVFSIHGELFHYQGPLLHGSQELPKFAQLFFYDPDYATNVRMQQHPDLDRSILKQLSLELDAYNPFIPIYKTARERLLAQESQLRIILNPQMKLIVESGADRRRENLPTSEEIAVIIPYEYMEPSRRDILLATRNPSYGRSSLEKVSVTNAAYMPLHYVLLFPKGDLGWHYGMELGDRRNVRSEFRLGQRTFYRFRLHVRKNEFCPLFYARRLFQQFVVDAYVACEQANLDWIRNHQGNFRADVYNGLRDALQAGDVDPANIGRRFILPSSFTGSDRYMQQVYQDSMAVTRVYGKPSLFITFTANPKWPEITEQLSPGQQPIDRPDITVRVFFLKVKELIKDLRKNLFGRYKAHVYTIEYQKRGLPHVHLLLYLDSSYKYDTSSRIDNIICAELPDPAWDPTGELTDLIKSTMSHGPCGQENPFASCMVRKDNRDPGYCSKHFPKQFASETRIVEDGYPEYRRRNNGQTFTVPHPQIPGQVVVRDNRWIVPYNPYLLQKYQAHVNVELCATVQAVKYLAKYITKGHDKSTLAVNANDEITQHCQGRYIGPCEGFARIFKYKQHDQYPPVQPLAVHLENEQVVYFTDDLDEHQIANRRDRACSTLMGYFEYNRLHTSGRHLLYSEFPSYYTWNSKDRKWQPRQKGRSIGRMYYCSPLAGERYYLRLLLTVVRGPQSFTDLYRHNGIAYPTYRAACIAWGLAEDDQEWFHCIEEAALFTSGSGLRMLLVTALRLELLGDPLTIWDRFKDKFCDDLIHRLRQPGLNFPLVLAYPEHDYGLFLIGQGLAEVQRTLRGCKLPENVFNWDQLHSSGQRQQGISESADLSRQLQAQFNTNQASCFNAITTAITDDPQNAHFYLQGPGGTGKTFLYKALCHYYRGLGLNVLCVASTGIAALLLPDGRTAHSRFGIPIELHESATCSISMSSKVAASLRAVDLIIWDEVPMQHKYCFEAVHRLFCNLRMIPLDCPDPLLFGGTPVILGGDFAQILPVIKQGSRTSTVIACLQKSFIWPKLKQLRLRTNMRVRNSTQDGPFRDWISRLPYDASLNGSISIPSYISQPRTIMNLIDIIYPQSLLQRPDDYTSFRDRAILTTRNCIVHELNSLILTRFPGALRSYRSVDTTDVNESESGIDQVPPEFLHAQSPPELPLSALDLKVGVPIMVLRNILPDQGLCNGTRMVVTKLGNHCIQGRILGGEFDGQLRTIPRIKLEYSGEDLPFSLYRHQFPVRISFAMTINKSQGQTFHQVGVDLRSPAFSHGQFYVAASRVSSATGLHILLPPGDATTTTNVVYPEVLADLN